MLAPSLNRRLVPLLYWLMGLSAALTAGLSHASEAESQGVLAQRFSWQSPLNLTEGYLAGKSWAQGLRLVGNSQGLNSTELAYSNPGLKLPTNNASAYLGLGLGYSLMSANRLDFFAGVGLSVGSSVGTTLGVPALNSQGGNAYELSTQRGLREMFGGMTLMPSASIGLVYRY